MRLHRYPIRSVHGEAAAKVTNCAALPRRAVLTGVYNPGPMKCPHCTKAIHVMWGETPFGFDHEHDYTIESADCPACGRVILRLHTLDREQAPKNPRVTAPVAGTDRYVFVHPRGVSRAPIDKAVPADVAGDYKEACLVLTDSPKASAALSRRCLQHLLREKADVKHGNLAKEIEEAMGSLPTHLAGAIDGVRNIGNFAAHPIKSEQTGEVVDVEPGEAEWNLDTLEGLFDHYYVQPALLKEKQEALNKKLAEAGKPEMKV
jgi:hypothetical protein